MNMSDGDLGRGRGNDPTYPESDHVGGIGFNRNEVVGHHGHRVAVNGESLNAFCTGVDQSEAVSFSRGELEFGDSGVGRALNVCERFERGIETGFISSHAVPSVTREQS